MTARCGTCGEADPELCCWRRKGEPHRANCCPDPFHTASESKEERCGTCGSKHPEADRVDDEYVERNIIPDSLLCPDPFHTASESKEARCETCHGRGVVDENGNPYVWGRSDSYECLQCDSASESKETRCGCKYPCVWPRSKGCTASESKSGGEGAGRTWTIAVDRYPRKPNGDRLVGVGQTGFLRWYADHPEAWEVIEVCPASDLTEALSLLAEARGELEAALDVKAWYSGKLDRAEARLAEVREVAEWVRNYAQPRKTASEVADRLDRALSNTTPETRETIASSCGDPGGCPPSRGTSDTA